MIVRLLIAIAILATVTSEEEVPCSSCIRHETDRTICYNVSYLFDINPNIFRNVVVIKKLGILRSTNTLFFSFEPSIENDEYSQVGFINLTQAESSGESANPVVLSGGKQFLNFGPFDLDQDNNLVYLGGSDGIYYLDTKVNRVAPYSSIGDKVICLFYRGHLYFIRDHEFKIIRKSGDNFDSLVDFSPVENFVINKYNVLVFSGREGLFASNRNEVVQLSNNRFIRGLIINGDDSIFAWWLDEIYRVVIRPKFADSVLERILRVPRLGAIAFDNNNNIIVTVENRVHRITKMDNDTIC